MEDTRPTAPSETKKRLHLETAFLVAYAKIMIRLNEHRVDGNYNEALAKRIYTLTEFVRIDDRRSFEVFFDLYAIQTIQDAGAGEDMHFNVVYIDKESAMNYVPSTIAVHNFSMKEADVLLSLCAGRLFGARFIFTHLWSDIPRQLRFENMSRFHAKGIDGTDNSLTIRHARPGPVLFNQANSTHMESHTFHGVAIEFTDEMSAGEWKFRQQRAARSFVLRLYSERFPYVEEDSEGDVNKSVISYCDTVTTS